METPPLLHPDEETMFTLLKRLRLHHHERVQSSCTKRRRDHHRSARDNYNDHLFELSKLHEEIYP